MIWTIIMCIFFWQAVTSMQMMLMGSFTIMSLFLWD